MIAVGGMLAMSMLNASAADINRKPMLTKAPPVQPAPVPVYNWTGFYIGGLQVKLEPLQKNHILLRAEMLTRDEAWGSRRTSLAARACAGTDPPPGWIGLSTSPVEATTS